MSALAGENAEAQKGIGIAQATIDTFLGANKAIGQGGIAGAIAAVGIIAAGLANVKNIISTKIPKPPGSSGGIGGNSTLPPAPSQPPSFNVVGQSGFNQVAGALGSQPPIQAFVVAGAVTNAQQLQNNTINQATF